MMKRLLRPLLSRPMLRLYHLGRAVVANIRYGFPARRLIVIGVTGTKGKTTTAHLIAQILEQAGFTVGLSSTVEFRVAGQRTRNETNQTVIDPFRLQRLARHMVRAGCQYWVAEVTSHAIDQFRVFGIPFRVAVFTSLSHDHLDYHGTLGHYRATKTRLFARPSVEISIVNRDDEHWKEFYRFPKASRLLYGVELRRSDPPSPEVLARKVIVHPDGSTFTVVTPVGQAVVHLKLPGAFNISNALAAVATGLSLGVRLPTIVEAIESVALVPGRMERVDEGQPFEVIIDYAHNPDSLEQVMSAIQPTVRGRLIHIFGATGDRDRTKRPIMGALSARIADLVIITDEEPYTEDPSLIRNSLIEGARRGRMRGRDGEEWLREIPDRRLAIAAGLREARKGDVVLITGMGAQRFRVVGESHLPWEERQVIEELLHEIAR